MKNPYKALERTLGYRFRRRHRLETALTHRSFRFEAEEPTADNQRLEFLGDAALGLVTASHLYELFPDLQEGDLTRIRSRLTNSKTLARLAVRLDLGSFLRLGRGEVQSGGHRRSSTLGDALESVIGAAFVDGGLRAVEKIFKKLFLAELQIRSRDHWQDNPKGGLQELAQHRWRAGPRYRTVREEGPPHSKVFTVEVSVNGQVLGTGVGASKRDAETEAARQALEQIE
jgi:ribonuclease III